MDCTWPVVGILPSTLMALQPPTHHTAAQGDMNRGQPGNLANNHTVE